MLGAVVGERVGLLIVRAWAERGSDVPLRAVVRMTTDLSAGLSDSVTLTDVDRVCQLVREWLSEIAAPVSGGEEDDLA